MIFMRAFLSEIQHEVMLGNQEDIEKQVECEGEEGL